MTEDFQDLSQLKNHRGYQKLQMIWAEEGKKVMDALTRNSKVSGKDSSLRYYAGMFYGFDVAISALERALQELEEKMGSETSSNVAELLKRAIPGDQK